jgi:creatinine amidohydrolase
MFPDELNAALAACPVCYVTYGLCEPHGPQNAVGQDALRPHGAACLAAQQFGGIVAPPHYWHIHELGIYAAWAHPLIGPACPWLTAIPPWMFFKLVCYHVRSVDAWGFHGALLFSGHAGPHSQDIKTMAEILQPHFATRIAFFTDYEVTPEEFLPGFSHGGSMETAYLWAVAPDCVDLSRLPGPEDPGPFFAMAPNAPETDRRTGERMVAGIAENLGKKARELLAEYDRLQPERRPLTFDDIEELWETEVRPRFGEFACMKDLHAESGQQAPPPDSRWFPQWKVPPRS